MPYVLYGDTRSGSATVELALAEIGAEVELREIPLDQAAQRGEGYGAVNPQLKLPTLITPEGETLTESAGILITLAERYPEAGLLPPSKSPERAQGLRWLIFIAAEIYPMVEIIDYPERFLPDGAAAPRARREQLREHIRDIWKRRWLIVEYAVGGTPWFLSGGFSVLDIYLAVVSRWAQTEDWRPDNLPRIEAIAAALTARQTTAPVWRRHFA